MTPPIGSNPPPLPPRRPAAAAASPAAAAGAQKVAEAAGVAVDFVPSNNLTFAAASPLNGTLITRQYEVTCFGQRYQMTLRVNNEGFKGLTNEGLEKAIEAQKTALVTELNASSITAAPPLLHIHFVRNEGLLVYANNPGTDRAQIEKNWKDDVFLKQNCSTSARIITPAAIKIASAFLLEKHKFTYAAPAASPFSATLSAIPVAQPKPAPAAATENSAAAADPEPEPAEEVKFITEEIGKRLTLIIEFSAEPVEKKKLKKNIQLGDLLNHIVRSKLNDGSQNINLDLSIYDVTQETMLVALQAMFTEQFEDLNAFDEMTDLTLIVPPEFNQGHIDRLMKWIADNCKATSPPTSPEVSDAEESDAEDDSDLDDPFEQPIKPQGAASSAASSSPRSFTSARSNDMPTRPLPPAPQLGKKKA